MLTIPQVISVAAMALTIQLAMTAAGGRGGKGRGGADDAPNHG